MSNQSDKRSVATDALETLGRIIDESAGRDAIHLAVEPVVAARKLHPGDHVGFIDGGVGPCDNPVGIVDPFLEWNVEKGQRFWLVVYPRQITSLRHVWTHPAFQNAQVPESKNAQVPETKVDKKVKDESKGWISTFASGIGSDYKELMIKAEEFIEGGEYWCEGGRFDGDYFDYEFWTHYEIVTGTKVPSDKHHSFFSCSC